MALQAGNIAGDLNIAQLKGGLNVNTNSGTTSFDLSNYLGIVAVVLSATNGASGTITNVYLSTSNDTNRSNSTNYYGTSGAGFTNLSDTMNAATNFQVVGVDTRATKRYLFLNWLAVAAGSNQTFDATVVAQAKYKTS